MRIATLKKKTFFSLQDIKIKMYMGDLCREIKAGCLRIFSVQYWSLALKSLLGTLRGSSADEIFYSLSFMLSRRNRRNRGRENEGSINIEKLKNVLTSCKLFWFICDFGCFCSTLCLIHCQAEALPIIMESAWGVGILPSSICLHCSVIHVI